MASSSHWELKILNVHLVGSLTTLPFGYKLVKAPKNAGLDVSSGEADEWENSVSNPDFTEVAVVAGTNPDLTIDGINYNPLFSFDGATNGDQFIKENFLGSALFSATDNTIFYVFKRPNVASAQVSAGYQDSDGERMAYFEDVSASGALRTDLVDANIVGSTNIEDEFVIARAASDASSRSLFLNGATEGTPLGSGASLNTTLLGDFAIGTGPLSSFEAEVEVAEMIVYNTALSAAEASIVESYLAIKWYYN